MKILNPNKTWANITDEIHRTKPHRDNLVEREALLGLQILLSQYELAKNEKNRKLIKFYSAIFKSYRKHSISRCIVWKR